MTELNKIYSTGCLICGTFAKLVIDHDHSCCPATPTCGKCVRGALCGRCNVRVGRYEANAEKVRTTIAYIDENRYLDTLVTREETSPVPKSPRQSPRLKKPKVFPKTLQRFTNLRNRHSTLTESEIEEYGVLSEIFVLVDVHGSRIRP